MTDSVRSEQNLSREAVMAARLLEVRLMGLEVTEYGLDRVRTHS